MISSQIFQLFSSKNKNKIKTINLSVHEEVLFNSQAQWHKRIFTPGYPFVPNPFILYIYPDPGGCIPSLLPVVTNNVSNFGPPNANDDT